MPSNHPKWGTPLFWFLCKRHLEGVHDKKRDLKGRLFKQDRGVICDYPRPERCNKKATSEYFPNLVRVVKQARGKKVPMLRELKEFST